MIFLPQYADGSSDGHCSAGYFSAYRTDGQVSYIGRNASIPLSSTPDATISAIAYSTGFFGAKASPHWRRCCKRNVPFHIEIRLVHHRRFKLFGQMDSSGRADFLAACTINAAPRNNCQRRSPLSRSVSIVRAFAGQAEIQAPQACTVPAHIPAYHGTRAPLPVV